MRALLFLALMAAPLCGTSINLLANGGFESGNLTGWSTNGSVASGCNTSWRVASGTVAADTTGCLAVPAPPEGTYAAFNSFNGPAGSLYLLQQTFTMPATVASAILNWSDAFNWSFGPGQARVFSVQVLDQSNNVLGTAYTQSVDPVVGEQPWTAHAADLTALLETQGGQSLILSFGVSIPEEFTGPAGMGLDAVSLDVEETPEPSTALLVIGGIALCLRKVRRAA